MSQASQVSIDAAVAAAGSKATYAGAGGAGLGWLLSSEMGVLIGVIIGIAGLAVNFYFKRREDRRLSEEHELRMEALRNGR